MATKEEAKASAKKKCVPHDGCKDGQHTYVVTCWQVGAGKEKAVAMRCQRCMIKVDLQEIESAETLHG
jgi:hypothetical protein